MEPRSSLKACLAFSREKLDRSPDGSIFAFRCSEGFLFRSLYTDQSLTLSHGVPPDRSAGTGSPCSTHTEPRVDILADIQVANLHQGILSHQLDQLCPAECDCLDFDSASRPTEVRRQQCDKSSGVRYEEHKGDQDVQPV